MVNNSGYNYDNIKTAAKENGLKVTDLLALSPGCDPFYVGSPGQMAKAYWGARMYENMGSPSECHIRRVHYWVVSQKPRVIKPDGEEYLNTQRDWEFLNLTMKYARYAGFIPAENFVDRRNPPPIVNAKFWYDEVPSDVIEDIDKRDIIDMIDNKVHCHNPDNTQPYMLEIFCEKSTMNDILGPLCRQYGINLVCGLGELSITAVRQLVEDRAVEADKPVRVLYISDFDPAGECMPVSVARKIEYFVRIADDAGFDIKLKSIMLTQDQCEEFDLPRTPIKETERRKAGFEERKGGGATELDALESLYPGELKKIVTAEILEYFDVDAWNTAVNQNNMISSEIREHLGSRLDDIESKLQEVLVEIDTDEMDDFTPDTGPMRDESNEAWLYESDRGYVKQINAYRRHKEI